MTTYNYNVPNFLRGQIAELFQAVKQTSMVEKMFGTINVPASPSLKEVQGSYLHWNPNTHISDELEFIVGGGLQEANVKFPVKWIHTDISVRKTLYDSKASTAIPSNIQANAAGDHNLQRDEFLIMGSATKAYTWPGFLKLSSTGTIVAPADCCTTAGTANTSAGPWVGSQATAFTFETDLLTMKGDIISEESTVTGQGIVDHQSNGAADENDWVLFLHPNVALHLQKKVYNGSYYLDISYENYIKQQMGINIIYTKFADADGSYDAGEDSTTEAWLTYKPKQNFFMGVVVGLGWDSEWGSWLDDAHVYVNNRLQEKIGGFIRPYNIDGTYKKAATCCTIEPWDNVAD